MGLPSTLRAFTRPLRLVLFEPTLVNETINVFKKIELEYKVNYPNQTITINLIVNKETTYEPRNMWNVNMSSTSYDILSMQSK